MKVYAGFLKRRCLVCHGKPFATVIVFSGSYSDRDPRAVFSSLDAANHYQQYLDNENEPEEFELDSIGFLKRIDLRGNPS